MAQRIQNTSGVEIDVKPMQPQTSAVVTTTTAVDICAAVTGKKLYITRLWAVNKTTAEYSTLLIATDNATPVTVCYMQPGNPTAADDAGGESVVFDPPYEVPAGETITAETTDATTGDYYVTACGWVQE